MAALTTVVGWKLGKAERAKLLTQFPPRYETVVADHITLERDASGKPLPEPVQAAIVGRADDGEGLETMVVTINGNTERPDGSIYHITWSLGPGRHARESNDVLAKQGWEAIDPLQSVTLIPARF